MKSIFPMIVAVVAGAVLTLNGIPSPANAAEPAEFSDEQVVRGLVFGEGEFAKAIDTEVPLPEGLSGDVALAYEEVKDVITADIVSQPEAVDPILADLRSGNPYRVLVGFEDLANSFEVSMKANFPESVGSVDVATPRVCGPTVCAAAVVAAVAAVTAIAAVNFNVAGNVNMIWNQNGLWTTNGMWIGRNVVKRGAGSFDNIPSVDPGQRTENYPELVHTEVAARVATTLSK